METLENPAVGEQSEAEEIIVDRESPGRITLERELVRLQREDALDRAYFDTQFAISKELQPLGFLVASDRVLGERALADAEGGEKRYETHELDEALGGLLTGIYGQLGLMKLLATGRLNERDLAEEIRSKGHEVDSEKFEEAIKGIKSLVSTLG